MKKFALSLVVALLVTITWKTHPAYADHPMSDEEIKAAWADARVNPDNLLGHDITRLIMATVAAEELTEEYMSGNPAVTRLAPENDDCKKPWIVLWDLKDALAQEYTLRLRNPQGERFSMGHALVNWHNRFGNLLPIPKGIASTHEAKMAMRDETPSLLNAWRERGDRSALCELREYLADGLDPNLIGINPADAEAIQSANF